MISPKRETRSDIFPQYNCFPTPEKVSFEGFLLILYPIGYNMNIANFVKSKGKAVKWTQLELADKGRCERAIYTRDGARKRTLAFESNVLFPFFDG